MSSVQQACAGVVVAKKRQREKLKVLLRRAQIRKRVRAIARQIERDCKGESVHLICILKGACIFLADLLREQLRLTATHLGCEHGVCGACTVLIDGAQARSCIALAVSLEGAEVRSLEGMAEEI
ncbi:MAG: hypothetical protein IH793_07275, partial [Acidobacteria bacterium]|nr:hypothetical protein [Acidobacteriota bacterium]